MAGVDDAHAYVVRVRPKPALIRSGLLTLLIVPLPIFTALLFLGLPNGSWPVAVYGEIFCVLLCGIGFLLFRATFVGVTATTIVERSFFGARTISLTADVASMVLVHTYSTSTAETLPQLIVRDREGVRLLRLRGIFWTEESMRAVATSIEGELELPTEAITADEFFERYPGSAYWFENRPVVAAIAGALVITAGVAIVLGLMLLLGLPINGT
ncbi:hypothetical protein [Glaciihabitans sp. UYNi722]|uniref:hypothetical protein n=1 Tax=Glaciihabitans sp. UYNi722 TaxID=3156344 RepID=UPI00339AF0B6